MSGTGEMIGLWGLSDKRGKHTGSKNTNKVRNKQIARVARQSRRRNRRAK